MSNPEQSRGVSLYDELFTGFTGLAALRGVTNHGPLDSSQEPGKDGTLTPDGDRATGYDYVIPEAELPESLRDKGIDELTVGSYTATTMGDSVWNARAWVYIHERVGLIKYVTFYKDPSGEIEANFSLEGDPVDRGDDATGLSDEQINNIIDDLFSGDDSWLSAEGPAGDFARALHSKLEGPGELDVDDFELLQEILAELSK